MGKIYTYKDKLMSYGGVIQSKDFGFLPSRVSGLQLWLDANDSNTIIKDPSDYISQWNDKSVNGWNMAQAIFDNRPQLIEGEQNGKDVVRFDGINDVLRMDNADHMNVGSSGITFYFSFKANELVNYEAFFNKQSYTGVNNGGYILDLSASGGLRFWYVSNDINVIATYNSITTDDYYIARCEIDVINNEVRLTVNNESTIISAGVINPYETDFLFSMNHDTRASIYAGASDNASLISYNRILTTEENTQITNYLSNKWGITI